MKFFILISLIFLSFTTTGQKTNFPKVISKLSQKPKQKEFYSAQRWLRKVKYIGVLKDTLLLDEDGYSVIENNEFPPEIGRMLYSYSFDCKGCLSIDIDTSQILPLSNVESTAGNVVEKYYPSYPVIIKNNADSFYKIGFGLKVNVIAEALDVDNRWKPFEAPYVYRCGTGLMNMYLKPSQIACILFPKYSGNYKTKIRLRINNNFSSPFIGSINRNQFKMVNESF